MKRLGEYQTSPKYKIEKLKSKKFLRPFIDWWGITGAAILWIIALIILAIICTR